MTAPLHELIPPHSCIPVVTVPDTDSALHVAGALHSGGLRVVEFTLRAGDGFAVVAAVRKHFPDLIVGLGTVLAGDDVAQATRAGAHFIVSPGYSDALAAAARRAAVPWLPGVGTSSEVMCAREAGFGLLKFFPAAVSGGTAMLRQFAAVFADMRFCPTGGITAENGGEYLALANVHCIGGSWVTPDELIRKQDWAGISALARRAMALA